MLKKERDNLIKSFKVIEDMCSVFGNPEEPAVKNVNQVFKLISAIAQEPREWLENYMPEDDYFIPGKIG